MERQVMYVSEVDVMQMIQMSLSATVFILAVILVRAVTITRLPKKTFLILWGMALVQLLIPFRIPSIFSVYSKIPEYVLYIDENADVRQQSGQSESSDGKQTENEKQSSPLNMEDTGSASDQQQFFGLNMDLLRVVWAVGCGLCLLFFAAVYIRCRVHFLTAVSVKCEFADLWLQKHCKSRSVRIRQSGFVNSPLTYGLFRPVILMPETTDWTNTKQLSYILMHEWIHIKRFDMITKFVLAAALAIHWLNPLVWVMYVLCNRDLELSCDETVIRMFGEAQRSEYAHLLIYMQENRSKMTPLCNNFHTNAMQERITAIMKYKNRTIKTGIIAAVLICMLVCAFATAPWESKVQSAKREDASEWENSNITNISLNLGNHRAEEIADKLVGHMRKKYEGVYDLNNFAVTFCNEAMKDDMLSLDIEVSADMTLMEHPKDSPYATGMREEIDHMKDSKKKKMAEKVYRDYLQDVTPYYMQPEETGFSYQVHLPASDAKDGENPVKYQLFYLGEDASIIPIEENEHLERARISDGRNYIEENL